MNETLVEYLDQWEQSYGFAPKPIPDHWSIGHRIADLRKIAEETL